MITKEDVQRVADYLLGTYMNVEAAMDYLGIEGDPDEVEERLTDLPMGIERCSECDWWVYSYELVDDDLNPSVCDGCK